LFLFVNCADRSQFWFRPAKRSIVRSCATISCRLSLQQFLPAGLPLTQLSGTHLRFAESSPSLKEYCGTSCACRKWREWNRYPAPPLHLRASGRRTRPLSASKSVLQCSSSSLSLRKHDGRLGL